MAVVQERRDMRMIFRQSMDPQKVYIWANLELSADPPAAAGPSHAEPKAKMIIHVAEPTLEEAQSSCQLTVPPRHTFV